jgi:hypothetical protein
MFWLHVFGAHVCTYRYFSRLERDFDFCVTEVAIPTGIPIVYKFDKQMKPIPPTQEERTVSQIHMNGLFLEKPGLLKEAFKREQSWAKAVPGYDDTMARHKTPMSSLERSLYKLNAIRELGEWASEFIDPNAVVEDDGNDGNMGRPIQYVEDKVWEMGMKELESGGQFDPDAPVFHEAALVNDTDGATTSTAFIPSPSTNAARTNEATIADNTDETETMVTIEPQAVPTFYSQPCVKSMPSESFVQSLGDVPIRRDSVIVIIRHGKTQHNKLGLFTGWVSGYDFFERMHDCSLTNSKHL